MSITSDALAFQQANLCNAGLTVRMADRTVTFPPLDQMMAAISQLKRQVAAEQRLGANPNDVGPRALVSDFSSGRGAGDYGRMYTD